MCVETDMLTSKLIWKLIAKAIMNKNIARGFTYSVCFLFMRATIGKVVWKIKRQVKEKSTSYKYSPLYDNVAHWKKLVLSGNNARSIGFPYRKKKES